MGPEQSLLLRCGRFFDAQRQELSGPADVLVTDGRIASVGQELAPGAAVVVDLRDCSLLPGLVDLDADLIPEPVSGDTGLWLYEALAGARDLLRRGFTTARVLGGADRRWSLLDLRQAIAAGLAPGADLLVAPHLLDDRLTGTGIAAAVTRELRNGADWIAVDRREVALEDLREIVGGAAETPVAVAAHTITDISRAIAAGARSIEVACELDASTLRLLIESDSFVVPRDGFATTEAAELRLCFGGRLSGGIPALADLITPPAALAAATTTGARCAGLDTGGAIRAGARADLVAVAGDPLSDPGLLDQPSLVVKGGRIES